jgi:inosose dehydratase
MAKIKLGIAPIGWTNDDMPDLGGNIPFGQCIDEMSKAGFTGTEIGNKYPKDPKALKKALKEKGLVVANSWYSAFILTKPMTEVEADFRAKCAFLKAAGAKIVGASEQSYSIQGKDIALFKNKYVMNEEEWKKLTGGLNYLGKVAQEYGLSLTYHHHMGTVVQDEAEVDKFMRMTDPKYVSLLYDSGHFAYCGADYLGIIKRYIDRIKHIHVKDIRPAVVEKVKKEGLSFLKGVRIGTFSVPGDGIIDFDPIIEVIANSDYKGWVLVEAEQDPEIYNPFIYAKKAHAYLSGLLKRYKL